MAKAKGKKGEVAPILQRVSARFELRPALAALKTISQPATFSRQILRHLSSGVSLNRLPSRLANGYASLSAQVLARYGRFNQTFNPLQRALRMPRRPQLFSEESFDNQTEANFEEWSPFSEGVAPASLLEANSHPDYFGEAALFDPGLSNRPAGQMPTALGRALERLEKPQGPSFSGPENGYAAASPVERGLSFPAMVWRKLAGFEPAQPSATSRAVLGDFEPALPTFSQPDNFEPASPAFTKPEISRSAVFSERPEVNSEPGADAVRQEQARLPATSNPSPAQSAVPNPPIQGQPKPSIQESVQGAGSYGFENTVAPYSNPRQPEGTGRGVLGSEGAVARYFEREIARLGSGWPQRPAPTALARALSRVSQPLGYLPQPAASFGIETQGDFARAGLIYRNTGQINRQPASAQEGWAEPEIGRSYQQFETNLPLQPEVGRVYQPEPAQLYQAKGHAQPSPETAQFNQIEAGARLSAEVARLYRAEGGGPVGPEAGRFNQVETGGLISANIARIHRAEGGNSSLVTNFTGNLFSAEAPLPLVGGRESGLIARQYGVERQAALGWTETLPTLRHNPLTPLTGQSQIQTGFALAGRGANEATFGGGDLPLYHRIARSRSSHQDANGNVGAEQAPWFGLGDQSAVTTQSNIVNQPVQATGASLADQAIIQRLRQLESRPVSPTNLGGDNRAVSFDSMESSGLAASLAPTALQRVMSRLETPSGLSLNLTPAEVRRYLNEPLAGTPGASLYGQGPQANATYPSNAGVGDYTTPPLVLRKAGEYAPDRPESAWRFFGESAGEAPPFRAGVSLERAYQPLALQAAAPQAPGLPELKLASAGGASKGSPVSSNAIARIVQLEAESSFTKASQPGGGTAQSEAQIERLALPLAGPGPRLQTITVSPEVLVDAAIEAVENRLGSSIETTSQPAPVYNLPAMPLATHFATNSGQGIGVVGAVQPGVTIQRKVSDAASSSQVSAGLPPLDTVLRTSVGKPLDSGVQSKMGEIFGTRFDHVRVHTEGPAADYAEQVGAEAFTHGSQIVFRAGRYQPQTITGQALIGHELTHVIQQASLPSLGQGRMPETSPQGQALEHIAQRNEQVLMEHLSTSPNGRSNSSSWDSGPSLAATNTVIERIYQPVETNHLRAQEAQTVRRATSSEYAPANNSTVRRVNEDGYQAPGEGSVSAEVDVKLLANQVYQLLKERLIVERERSGLRGGSFF